MPSCRFARPDYRSRPFLALGRRDAVFLVVPLFDVLLAWATYVVGTRLSARVGPAGALLTACSPHSSTSSSNR